MSFVINSGLRIFDVIKTLWENPATKKEFAEILGERGINVDPQIVSKYLRTLRAAGFEIDTKGKYMQILKTPFCRRMSKEELEGLFIFLSILNTYSSTELKKKSDFLRYKLLNLTDYTGEAREYGIRCNHLFPKAVETKIFKLMKYVGRTKPAVIQIKTHKEYKQGIVLDITFKVDGPYVLFFAIKENRVFNIKASKLSGIKYVLEYTPSELNCAGGTVFKITGRLVQNYTPRYGELVDYRKDYLIVSNALEDKEELFCRLLKYGTNCEIIRPISDREKFKKFLTKMIRRYKSM